MSQELGADVRGIRKALERIADVMEGALAMPPPAPPADCQHPEDQRIDFGVTNGVEDFQCRKCGFRPDPQEAIAHE